MEERVPKPLLFREQKESTTLPASLLTPFHANVLILTGLGPGKGGG